MTKQKIIDFMGIKLIITEYVFEPSDDTELLAKAVTDYIKPGSKVLEIGCGSGAISILLAKMGCKVTATDINPKAIEVAKRNAKLNNVRIRFVVSDLFAGLNETYDVVVFNPPYLPEDEYDFFLDNYHRLALVGGKKGNEVIIRFLRELPQHLRPNGEVYFVLSSLSEPEEVYGLIEDLGFRYIVIASKSFFFEKILVVRIWKDRNRNNSVS